MSKKIHLGKTKFYVLCGLPHWFAQTDLPDEVTCLKCRRLMDRIAKSLEIFQQALQSLEQDKEQ